jgi:transposase
MSTKPGGLGSDRARCPAGTVWGVATPTTAFYRILPGKSADEERQVLGDYRGTVVVDGYAVYEVLARAGPGFALAHCWAHTKRKFEANATDWPTACGEIDQLIRDLYAVERLVPGRFPGDTAAQAFSHQLRQERSRAITERIKTWAMEQVGLRRRNLGKAVRYLLERWSGLTRFLDSPCIPLDNNAAERVLRGPVVGRKNHYGSKSLRGTQVAALFYTLCESAKLGGVDPHMYLLTATEAALAVQGKVTLPAAVAA